MARYASGKKAWGYSDRSGFRYRLAEMITEWNGAKVGPDEYEPKHPQLSRYVRVLTRKLCISQDQINGLRQKVKDFF